MNSTPTTYSKNLSLVASALDDWEDADHYRLIAGQAYTNYAVEAKRSNDEGSLKLLEDLRRQLDELQEFGIEDASMMTKEQWERVLNDLDDEEVNMRAMMDEALSEDDDAQDEDSEGYYMASIESEDQEGGETDYVNMAADRMSPLVWFTSELTIHDTIPALNIVPQTDSDDRHTTLATSHRLKSIDFSKGGAKYAQDSAKSIDKSKCSD